MYGRLLDVFAGGARDERGFPELALPAELDEGCDLADDFVAKLKRGLDIRDAGADAARWIVLTGEVDFQMGFQNQFLRQADVDFVLEPRGYAAVFG